MPLLRAYPLNGGPAVEGRGGGYVSGTGVGVGLSVSTLRPPRRTAEVLRSADLFAGWIAQ